MAYFALLATVLLFAFGVNAAPTRQGRELAACVPSTGVTLSLMAPPFARFGEVIGGFLSAGGTVEALEQRLADWGALSADFGLVRDDADFDGDGLRDVVVISQNIDIEELFAFHPGNIFVYVCADGGYELAHQGQPDDELFSPSLDSLADLDGDGADELLYDFASCGAHTCYHELFGFRWDAGFVTLFEENNFQPYPLYNIEDRDADGVMEIVVDGGAIGSIGAGPQRTYEFVYEWDGGAYTLAEENLTSEQHAIHIVNDADRLLADGEAEQALALYERSFADDTLETFTAFEMESLDEALEAYARYKMVVAYARLGDVGSALAAYNGLRDEFKTRSGPPAEFAEYGSRFWATFLQSNDIALACDAVVAPLLGGQDFSFDSPLNQFGYANKFYQPLDMCPFASDLSVQP